MALFQRHPVQELARGDELEQLEAVTILVSRLKDLATSADAILGSMSKSGTIAIKRHIAKGLEAAPVLPWPCIFNSYSISTKTQILNSNLMEPYRQLTEGFETSE